MTLKKNSFLLSMIFALITPDIIFAQAPELNYAVSWIGNSFSGKTAWVLQDVADICVLPDGTLFTNVGWDEGGANVQEYRAGEVVGVAEHTHGWGYGGGAAVAANSKYLFIAQQVDNEGGGLKGASWPEKGLRWCGISRRLRSDIRKPAPFEGGRGGQGDTLRGAFLPVAEYPDKMEGAIRGMCADETRLYVSSPFDDSIKVYDTETMALLKSIPFTRPDRICLDRKGKLWILQRPETAGGAWSVLSMTVDGKLLPQKIALPAGVTPTAICVDSKGRLLIADAGPDNQIKIYGDLDAAPKLAGTFGVRGGIFAPPVGTFGDLRFNRPVGVGADDAGRIYVASDGQTNGGGTVLECYHQASGKLQWRRFGLLFVDCPAANPRRPEEIYTKEEHFTADYSRSPGQEGTYRGYTLNPQRYPDDPRLHLDSTNARIEILGGRPLLFVSDMTGEYLSVYRFNSKTDGETAIPCALFAKKRINNKNGYPAHQPERGAWIWTDKDGDGKINADEFQSDSGVDSSGLMTPDANGTIWQTGNNQIRALPLQNVDAKGVPHWDYKKAQTFPKPPELDEIRRLRYLPERNILLLGGNRGGDHNQHWKPMGPVLCLYDHWSGGKPVLRKSIILPYEKGSSGHESAEPISFDVAGDYIFVAYTRGLKGDGIQNAFVKVLRLSDLSIVGNLSAESQVGETGLLDLVESAAAVRRANGEYLVFLEDDMKSKSIMFRWKPK